jgi:hypothetical protein
MGNKKSKNRNNPIQLESNHTLSRLTPIEDHKPKTRGKCSNISWQTVLNDFFSGMSQAQMARKYNLCKASVKERLGPVIKVLNGIRPEDIEIFRSRKADLIDAVQLKVLTEMSKEHKIERAGLKDLSSAFKELHTGVRLERGESTQNVSMKQESFVNMIKEVGKDKGTPIEQI